MVGDVVQPLQEPRSAVVRLALHHQRQVLDEERHAAERPLWQWHLALRRLLPGALEPVADDRVELRVDLLDAGDRRLDQFGRARPARAHQFGLGGRVEEGELRGRCGVGLGRVHGGTVERLTEAVSVVAMRVLAAVDKFRGTATAREVADAIAAAAARLGHDCDRAPVSDGGEGWLEAFGGANRRTMVSGPLGDPVEAAWRLQGDTAVVEMARASGLDLVGGAGGNDPMAASTTGTGELIDAALDAGARRIIVGLGGSATTDGGFGAVRAIRVPDRLRRVELLVACDVRTTFVDAARVFAGQKGASPAQVQLLTGRLERLAQVYEEQYGVDVRNAPGAGAAGGLAGGLLALGGELLAGFDLLADELELSNRVAAADLVITGEGFVDAQSFDGKVVGGVARLAARHQRPVVAIAGDVDEDAQAQIDAYSLVERFGDERARTHTLDCIEQVVSDLLAGGAVSRPSSPSSGSCPPPAT